MTQTVFVYGTLTDRDRAATVLDEFSFRAPATLDGLHRVDGEYPTLAPGGRVSGRLLTTPDLDALDRYEGVERGLYCRVEVPLVEDGALTEGTGATAEGAAKGATEGATETIQQAADSTCWTYVGDPDRLGAGCAISWPNDGPFAERVRAYVRDEPVVVRRD